MERFRIDWLPGEPIILGKMNPDYNVRKDTPAASKRLLKMLDSTDQPVAYVLDLSEVSMSFGEMVGAMGVLTRGDLAAFSHPRLTEIVIISSDPLIRIGASALGQTQYGRRRAAVMRSLEDALRYVRRKSQLLAASHSAN
jgi:hypothetical protein